MYVCFQKKKANAVRHIKSCYEISRRKMSNENNKTCPVCQVSFSKKYNRDRHMYLMHENSVIDDSSMDISTSSLTIDVATIDETIIDEVPISMAANNEFALESPLPCFARAESTINEITIDDIAVDVSANDEFASVALVESTINESTTVSTCLQTTSLRVLHWSNQRSKNRQPCRRVCKRRVCECCIGRINDQ